MANKARYQNFVVSPAETLVESLNRDPTLRKLGLHALPKKALFRLHRDVRFSADKSPLKTHNGIVLSRSGSKNDNGVLYLHIDPKESMVAAGFWQPDPKLLTRFRLWMTEHPEELKSFLKSLSKNGLELSGEDKLKRAPRGFERVEDPVIAEQLLHKNFICTQALSLKEMSQKTLVKKIATFAQAASPLFKRGWIILDAWRREGGDPSFQELG